MRTGAGQAGQYGPLLAAGVRSLMEFPRPLASAGELARLATSGQLTALGAYGPGKPFVVGAQCCPAPALWNSSPLILSCQATGMRTLCATSQA